MGPGDQRWENPASQMGGGRGNGLQEQSPAGEELADGGAVGTAHMPARAREFPYETDPHARAPGVPILTHVVLSDTSDEDVGMEDDESESGAVGADQIPPQEHGHSGASSEPIVPVVDGVDGGCADGDGLQASSSAVSGDRQARNAATHAARRRLEIQAEQRARRRNDKRVRAARARKTTATYNPKARLFRKWCRILNYSNDDDVTSDKLLRFLTEYLIPRGNLRARTEDGKQRRGMISEQGADECAG